MNTHAYVGRPSPWRGAEHVELHGWELDDASSLPEVVSKIRAVAAELEAAHEAGWSLESPMLDGRLHARRPSRRQRARDRPAEASDGTPPEIHVRVRIVDEPARSGRPVLTFDAASATTWLATTDGDISRVAGPPIDDERLRIVTSQVAARELGTRRWAVVAARVGPGIDLVADGTALRTHAVVDGVLVRTAETLAFKHAADRAATLPDAAAAYRRLAQAAAAMNAVGGHLESVDDGFVLIEYSDHVG